MMTAQEKARQITARMMGCGPDQSLYTFHREGHFYPLVLGSDAEAIANAKCNPGTLKVVNELTGATVWPTN
ncbi:hypothetical protein ABNQ39_20385 [Azospirillum sp. A26]|uniref:hypothetical protein n=1 Tax=Azospirillum sp. A26 TaxID=3160607 RepID=UPI003672FC79